MGLVALVALVACIFYITVNLLKITMIYSKEWMELISDTIQVKGGGNVNGFFNVAHATDVAHDAVQQDLPIAT